MSDKLGLFKKITAVMKDVDYLSKDDNIEFKNTKYKAISEEKVTRAVRGSMVEHGLIIIPIEQEHSRDGNLSTVNTKYKIIDIETGEYEVIVSSGTGADTQDKGVGKAMTYAYKYLLLRTFSIPTGEDPDKVSSAELDSKEVTNDNSSKPQQNTSPKPASEKQLKLVDSLIKDVAKKFKLTDAASVGTLKTRMETAKDINNYTSSEASRAIGLLQEAMKKEA